METIQIAILNPKAIKLLNGMQELNLIKVEKPRKSKLQLYLKKMRSNSQSAPSMDEITAIVESVRTKRYAKK